MKKILLSCLFFVGLVFSGLLVFAGGSSVPQVHAQVTCKLTTDPDPVTSNTKQIDIALQTSGLVPGEQYWIGLKNGGKKLFREGSINQPNKKPFTADSNGRIEVRNLDKDGIINRRSPINQQQPFDARAYQVIVQESKDNGRELCSARLIVQSACVINFTNTSFTPSDVISFSASPVKAGSHRVRIETLQGTRQAYENCHSVGVDQILNMSTTRIPAGVYKVIVRDTCNIGILGAGRGGGEKDICTAGIRVSTDLSQGGPISEPGGGSLGPVTPINTQGRCAAGQIDTAIGCIPYGDANSFVVWFLRWAIGIAGGVAFLLIIFSGFQIMTASNNPQQLQTGRELLTGAVSGLILIIFSAFLLKLIGVDILGIPGL